MSVILAGSDDPEIVRQLYLDGVQHLAAFAVVYYDYVITLQDEIQFFWRGGFSAASILFFLNRYLILFGNIPFIVLSFGEIPDQVRVPDACSALLFLNLAPYSCLRLQTYHAYLLIITQIVIGIVLFIRTYALYNRDKRVAFGLFLFAVAEAGIAMWSPAATDKGIELIPRPPSFQGGGCLTATSKKLGIHYAIDFAGLLAYDSTVFILTMYKTVSTHRIRHGSGRLLHIMKRDGAIYFFLLGALNALNIISYLLLPPLSKGAGSTFTTAVSSALVTRLMVNLRDHSKPDCVDVEKTAPTLGPFMMTTVVDRESWSDTTGSVSPEVLGNDV